MKTKNFLNESLNMKNAITPDNGSRTARHWLGNGSTKFHKNLSRVAALLCMMLTLGVGNAWGTTKTFAPTNFNGQGSSSGGNITYTNSPITVSSAKGYGYSTGQTRIITGGTLVISCTSGYAISAVALSFTSSNYQGGLSTSYTGLSTTSWTSPATTSTARISSITVTYDAAASKTLSSISITTQPSTTKYLVGETFSSTGAVVTATYSDATTANVSASATWTPSTALSAGTSQTITASYTEGVTKTATTTVDVYSVTVQVRDEDGNTLSGAGMPTASASGRTLTASASGNNYVFKRWVAVTAAGTSIASTSSASTSLTGTPTGAVTVKAEYYKPITITYKANGSTFTTQTYGYGGTLAFPASNPDGATYSCTDKTFVGWVAEANKDYSHASTPPTYATAGGSVTAAATYYAVFATASGGGTTWVLTELNAVTAGTYAIVNQSNKAFNGTITDGHGNVTSGTFSFTNGVATSAPEGTCEVTFEVQSSGFSLYNTYSSKYLYASKAASGGLAEQSDKPSDYWNYYNPNWQYHHSYSGTYARLRSASSTPGGLRVYGNNSGDGVIKLAKKTGGATYSDFVTTCGTCSSNPTIGVAALKGTFNASGVGVTCPTTGTDVQTNCSWTDYGFVWSTTNSTTSNLVLNADGTAPSGNNKVQIGTSGNANTFDGTIAPVLPATALSAGTYYYRAYGKNGYASGTYQYSSSVSSFVARSVTFNLNGHGSAIATQIVKDGTKAAEPSAPTADGYRFDGWYTDNGVWSSAWNFSSNTVSSNVTLYAKWTQVYTVTYNYSGGSGSCVAGGPYAAGATVTTCASATKAGSTLTGWLRSDNSAIVTQGNTFSMPAANVILTAQWEDTEYTLTQTVGANTTKGHSGTTITSGMTSPSGLDLTYTISAANKALPKSITISGGGQTWTLGTNYTWTLSEDKHSATLHIGSDLTITANVTVTVAEQARYTVVWDEHGSTTTEYYASDDNTVTEKTEIDDCGEKKFYRWTEDGTFVSDDDTPPANATFGTISGDKHYYAIYGNRTGGGGFVKVTSITAGSGYYMATGLTSSDYVYTGQNGANTYGACTQNNSTGSSFSGATLLAFPTAAKSLTVAISNGKFSLYDGTSYLGAANSNSLTFNNDPVYEWQLSTNKIQSSSYTSRYIKRNTQNDRVCAYSTNDNVADFYLYKPDITWSNFSKTCELYDITITTPSGGTVTTTPTAGTDAAGEGQTVTVNVTPNSCKYLSALKYNDGSDHAISIASTPYTFTMPASDVTVTATFSDKTVSSIAPNTNTHRTLMQSTSFVGEQIRVTFNNGETEDLAWNNAALTFTGYNMSTLGNQTVTVSYSGCGSTSTTYSIEITDGIPITFSDCGITSTTKYQPGDAVPVETTSGAYACSGWEFAGWSATSVAANSTSFTPVRNFNASTARTLYAVYAHLGSTFTSAKLTNELREGARYILAYYVNNNNTSYGLTGLLPTVKNTNYLQGTHTGNSGIAFNETTVGGLYQYTLTSYTPVSGVLWQLQADGTGYWQLYNIYQKKYLNLSNYSDGYVSVSTSPVGKLVLEDEDENPIYCNGSRVYVKYNDGTKRLAWNRNSGDGYWNQHTSGYQFFLTKDEYFSSTPPCAPRSVTFHGNGGIVTNYEETESDYDLVVTEASRDAGITTPTADMDASDCAGNDWTFMGWLDEEVDVSRVPILTTDLLNDGGGGKSHTITADDEEYWAVYSNTGPAETKYGTISFTKADFNSSYSSTENTTTKTVTSMGDYVFGYKNVGHSSEIGIQFQEDNGELYNKTSLGKVNSISFTTFGAGGINKLNVYVGDEEKTTDHLLTAAEMQNVGSTWTYYPTENESYVYITNVGKGNGSYVCVSGISIDFGRGTTIYATTPVCSTIRLSGDVYVTSRNGVGIMAVTPLSVEAHQLAANADVVITSNSSDVYFSKDRNANFAKAAANQPKTSVTVTANGSGELSATPIYVHYKPSIDGSGAATNVTVYANLSPADPNTKGEKAIHVRNLPNKVVIAAKVGGAYYALPANLNGATNPAAVLIDVDESNMTAIGPASCAYTIWPVKTTSGSGDRYALQGGNAYGERVRFSATNNSNKGLWANNASSDPKTRIDNDAAITAIGSDPAAAYEWKITTTVTDGKWSHTLQTDQSNNTKYLRYWTAASGGPKWGTYASGEQNIYLLPVTEVVQTEAYFVEWGQHGGVIEVDAGGVSATKVKAKLSGEESALQALSQTQTSVKNRESVYNYTVNFGNDIDFSAAASAGAALTLKWYNSSDVLVATSNIIVPRIIAESATMSSIESRKTYWTTENGPTNEVHVLPGVTLTADAGSFANSDVTIKQLEIYQGATVKVTTGTLDVDTLVLRNGWSRAGSKRYDVARLYIATTANLTTEANHTYADWYIDYDQYYPIAVPWDVTLANIRYRYCSVSPTIGDNQNIRLRYYDGASRASGGSDTNWKDYGKSGNTDMPTKIVPSQGYAITAKRPAGKAFSILRMPLTIPANTWTALGEQGEVTVSSVTTHKNQVSVEAYGDDKTPWYAKGWNFIANPYMSVFNGNDNGVTGKLMNQQGTSIKYATIPDTDFKDYYQVNMAEANLKPASGFLVQVGTTGTLTFSNGKIVAPSAPARISNESTAIPEQEAYIRLSNDAGYDQMGLIIGDDYTAEYEMNADLSKMLGETNALKTWLRYTNMDMAYVAINEQLAREWIPVTVNIPAEGEYTYTLLNSSTVDELEGVYLIDYQTGVTTNLIFDDYVFTAEAGTFDNRFAINAIVGKRDTPTGADITCGDEDGVKAIKFVYHDKVFILHRGVIYDSTGKRVNVINK